MSKKSRKIKYVEVSENDYPSKEKIWDKQYECRNFELSNFWQKSAFLFGFLSLCFAGYGALVAQLVDKDTNPISVSYIYQNMCGISFLGIVLSIVWIYMMKGSKAWYEVYEKSIYEIETEIFKGENEKYIEGEFAKKMRKDFNCNFRGMNGGAFSPAKINILIGWILLIVWFCCGMVSVYNLLCLDNLDLSKSIDWTKWSHIAIPILLTSVITLSAVAIIKKIIKSRPLLMNKEKKYSRTKFCKFLLSKFIKWMMSSFWRCILYTVLVGIFVFIRLFILILFIPIVCFVIYIVNNLRKQYEEYVKQEENIAILNKADTKIYQTIRNYPIKGTKTEIEKVINRTIKDVNISKEVERMIDKSADELIKDKFNDCLDIIIDKYIKDKISSAIEQKINNLSQNQIDKIVLSLKNKGLQV